MFPKIPEWVFTVVIWFAAIGAAAVFAGLVTGIYWLVTHLRFV